MRRISEARRRRLLVSRHCLDGRAADPDAATTAVLALHATDPASVYLSVLARCATTTFADVAAAMYERRTLVRWMAMRRTLFVFDRQDVPLVQAAISTPLAQVLRRRLVSLIERNGTEPPLATDAATWLAGLEPGVVAALDARGDATGAQLSADVPAMRTSIVPRAASERPMGVTSPLLTMISAQGHIVRGRAVGGWTTRAHRWEPVSHWWPDGMPTIAEDEAQRELARRWLERFGPATEDDLRWWMGWTKATVRRALAGLEPEEVDLHGAAGIDLADRPDEDEAAAPVAALLPALDPTAMGWQHRDWYFGIERSLVTDRNGNIGPTLWWDGEIVGSWAVAADGEVRTEIVADRGVEARAAVDDAAAALHRRLDGAVVTPVFRTELERRLGG